MTSFLPQTDSSMFLGWHDLFNFPSTPTVMRLALQALLLKSQLKSFLPGNLSQFFCPGVKYFEGMTWAGFACCWCMLTCRKLLAWDTSLSTHTFSEYGLSCYRRIPMSLISSLTMFWNNKLISRWRIFTLKGPEFWHLWAWQCSVAWIKLNLKVSELALFVIPWCLGNFLQGHSQVQIPFMSTS